MKVIKIFAALLLSFSMSFTVQAASLSNPWKYISSDVGAAKDASGYFSSDSGLISAAYTFSGNISNSNFETDLNTALASDGVSVSFANPVKYDGITTTSGVYDDPNVYVNAVLLKSSTENAFFIFNSSVDYFEWVSNGTNRQGGIQALSHYVVNVVELSEVPVPAAAFLFAPVLLAFIGLRRKAKA